MKSVAQGCVGLGLYLLLFLALTDWIGIVDVHWPWERQAEQSTLVLDNKPQQTPSKIPVPSNARDSLSRPSTSVEPHSELVAGKNDVRQMLTYAMTKGGVDHEADIAAAKRRVESLTLQRQSDPGLRKQAREANERGLGYSRADKWAEAVQAFQAAYKADSTDVEIINNLGYASLRHGDLQAAEALFLRALIFAPGRSSAWANLGETYAQKGNLQAAVACFANAYRFPRNQDATHQFLQKLTHDSVENVREAARQSLQLQLIEKTSKQARGGSPPSQSTKDSRAAGQSTGSPGLPAALLPKLTIGPWTINGTVASAFVGQWSGTVIQTGSVSDQFPVVITIRSGQSNQRLGAVDYPTLGCSGELNLSAASSVQIIVEESLTKGLSACTNHTKVTLTLSADGTLGYSTRVSTASGSAVLRKAD